MSRIGQKKISFPPGVQARVEKGKIIVEGPKGGLTKVFPSDCAVTMEEGGVVVRRLSDDRDARALHGVVRSVIANMVIGVTQGHEKSLEINGIGYRAQIEGRRLIFHIGRSRPVEYPLPPGVDARVEKQTLVTITGVDKALVGQVASDLRALKEPDPYKGKGIKYQGERLIRKEGKRGK